MDRLIAADVMGSNKLCYVYPITRVQSVERLLKTTAYSAFLVVTPVEPEHVPERPKNVEDTHTPQLYTRSSIGGEWTVTEGETADIGGRRSDSMGIQSPTYTDEDEDIEVVGTGEDNGRKLLVFHGIILRSQLIELIKNKVFFNETDGVRE